MTDVLRDATVSYCRHLVHPCPRQTSAIILPCRKDHVVMLSEVASGCSCSARGHSHHAPVTPLQLRWLWHRRRYSVLRLRPKAEGSYCRYLVSPHPHQTSAITLPCWNTEIGMLSVMASGHSCSARGHSHHAPVTPVQLRWLWHRRRYSVLGPKAEGSCRCYLVRPHPGQPPVITLRSWDDDIPMLRAVPSGPSCSAHSHAF